MKHTAEDLKMMQALPLDMKVQLTKDRIRSWVNTYGESGCYISYSGGKDSTVLMHLVKQDYPDVPAVFCDTGLEYPEVRAMAIKNADVVLKPNMRFREVIDNYGYPVVGKEVSKYVKEARSAILKGDDSYYAIQKLRGTLKDKNGNKSAYNCEKWGFLIDAPYKISHQCCDVMKKLPAKKYENETGRKPFIGTMTTESRLRREQWNRFGCNAYEKSRPSSTPMAFWTDQDVLSYILRYKVDIPSVYGDIISVDSDGMEYGSDLFGGCGSLSTTGCKRTGCVFCAFGISQDGTPNRFQRLKQTHPKLWSYCIHGGEYGEDGMWRPSKTGLGMGKVLDYINVPYE